MIALGSDHGGFDLKERVKAYLDREGIPYQDYGCHSKESGLWRSFSTRTSRVDATPDGWG